MKNKLLILCLLTAALGLRHLTVYYTSAEILHLEALADSFARMDGGDWWVSGQLLGGSGVRFGGPLYTWLNYPARLLSNPVLGAHLNNVLLELLSLGVWLFWPTGGRLRWDVRWIAALLLVLSPEPKAEVCENAATMVHLLPPVLVTFLWATRERAWLSMLLPGLLLGAAALVHASAAALAPALVVTLLMERKLAVRRLCALACGAALVGVALGHGAGHDTEQGRQLWRWIWENLSASRAALLMLHVVKDPLALLGVAVVLWLWRRGARPGPAELLALLWLLTGGIFVSLLYSRLDLVWDPFWPRFALVNPGRAVLAAVGLAWLLDRLNHRRDRRGRGALELQSALVVVAALAVVVMGAWVPLLRGKVIQARQRDSRHPCMCDRVEREMWSRYRMATFDELLQGGEALRPGAALARGLLGKDLAVASRWRPAGQRPLRQRRADPTAVFPPMSTTRPNTQGDPLRVVAGCAALDTRALTSGRLVLERGGSRPSNKLLVLLVNNQPTFRTHAPEVMLVNRGKIKVRQVGRCACREEGPFIGGWYLFDLLSEPLHELELTTLPRQAMTWEIHALFLPPNR